MVERTMSSEESSLYPPHLRVTSDAIDKHLDKAEQSIRTDVEDLDSKEDIFSDTGGEESNEGNESRGDLPRVPKPPFVKLILFLGKILCVCFRRRAEVLPEFPEQDPSTWEYEGPLEPHSTILRSLMCPRDAKTVYDVTKRVMLGAWRAMTIRDDNGKPIIVAVATLISRFGSRATTFMCKILSGGKQIVEIDLTELTVFVCRFSLMSPTALAILLFRAEAQNVEDFVSEASLSMEFVADLLERLRTCTPDTTSALRDLSRLNSHRRDAQKRDMKKLRRLAEKRGGDAIFLADFREFLREAPHVLQPIRFLQRAVWDVFGGVAFWGRIRREFQRRGASSVARDAESRWRHACPRCGKKFKTRKRLRRHQKARKCISEEQSSSSASGGDKASTDGASPRSSKSPRKSPSSSSMVDRRVSAYKTARRMERFKRSQQREITQRREREATNWERQISQRTTNRPQQEAETCVICLEKVELTQHLVLGSCGHLFHGDCIGKWLENCTRVGTKATCALCRCQWTTVDSSPGVAVASSETTAYRVPNDTLVTPTSEESQTVDETSVQNAWQWRHERSTKLDEPIVDTYNTKQQRNEGASPDDDDRWERYADLSGAVYWHAPLTARFRWDDPEGIEEGARDDSEF